MKLRAIALCAGVLAGVATAVPLAEASCFSSMTICLQEANEWANNCVNGNYWHDLACGAVQTTWHISCGAEFAMCVANGGP